MRLCEEILVSSAKTKMQEVNVQVAVRVSLQLLPYVRNVLMPQSKAKIFKILACPCYAWLCQNMEHQLKLWNTQLCNDTQNCTECQI